MSSWSVVSRCWPSMTCRAAWSIGLHVWAEDDRAHEVRHVVVALVPSVQALGDADARHPRAAPTASRAPRRTAAGTTGPRIES